LEGIASAVHLRFAAPLTALGAAIHLHTSGVLFSAGYGAAVARGSGASSTSTLNVSRSDARPITAMANEKAPTAIAAPTRPSGGVSAWNPVVSSTAEP